MTERDIKNFVGKLSRQMEQYGKNVGTDSYNYQHLKNLAIMSGLELTRKGDYEIPSAGKTSTERLRNMTAEQQNETVKKLESMQTWGEQKSYYEKRITEPGLNRQEKAEKIREEILKDDYMENELISFITEVYRFLQSHVDDGVYLDTLPSEPYRKYSEPEISSIVNTNIFNMSIDDIKKYVETVRAEISRGGKFGGISPSITAGLWKIRPEKP